ncbi:MAG: hypothetical protein A2600_04215 [Candidatus Lambdaproteobacteria bacterium RIFOXYD1_FULL_56_27]|uniref:Recombinase RmuC n=1 Tax=Candidatus Lambdaproteobacteria bacterium RIFOXYD2_FULL_56_26 TaxID=1817773 RepID=A0A1F6H3R5_9PROT|nr:MAG: hypothetical protein A2426_02015 [Candidatus Lambdaproteobacteria bacterium RIFOXYC1_FULL_56_13]OGH04960.1 MAG: hypothetical protein A2557_08280 [Candidatus Lambdaproteobacteria bacterium RIFOXYD2_FULL_56_26]OGH09425.1 MAG: hypothetical protein A2600_04215 [Candidatus Lambdaproteobacteria bacterium RIFOXYD1_FULL_56_27]
MEPLLLVSNLLFLLLSVALLVWLARLKGRLAVALLAENTALELKTQLLAQAKELEANREEYVSLHSQRAAADAALTETRSALEKSEGLVAAQKAELVGLTQAKGLLENRFTQSQTRLDQEEKAAREKLELLDKAKVQLSEQFENLANRIFENKGKQLSEKHQEELKGLFVPMKDQLQEFKKKVEENHETDLRDRVALKTELTQLKGLNQQLAQEAKALTEALKGDSKTQGVWGELVLERILEESGLTKGREYDLQVSFANEAGGRSRPDAVIHLPEGKDLFVDAKVSLKAYEQYHNGETEEAKALALKAHLLSIRNHIKELSARDYPGLEKVQTLDFVLMFIPLEAAFLAAHHEDPGLFKDAYEANILLASPSTLLVTLRTVGHLWRTERQNQNAKEIAEAAGRMIDKITLVYEAVKEVGDQLKKAAKAQEEALSRIEGGRGNLLSQAQKIMALGANPKKSLPEPKDNAPDLQEQ